MADDLSIFRVPPPSPDAIEGKKPASPSSHHSAEKGPSFQDTLKKTLGNLSEEADQIAKSPAPSFANMQKAMDAATTAFHDTMQAHQMMQQITPNMDNTKDSSGKES